jgi:hypothetical protein
MDNYTAVQPNSQITLGGFYAIIGVSLLTVFEEK